MPKPIPLFKSKAKSLTPVKTESKIPSTTLSEYTETSLKTYGSYVVENRAIPDYRDGLKNVHRAILWSMYNLNLHHTSSFKKSARTVGDVIGCFTGDTLVLLADNTVKSFSYLAENYKDSKFDVYTSNSQCHLIKAPAHSPRISRYTNHIVELCLESFGEKESHSMIQCTPEHPIRLVSGEYKEAADLTQHDMLLSVNCKNPVRVKSVVHKHLNTPIPVYDLTVDTYSNFFVVFDGAKQNQGICVHNSYHPHGDSAVYDALVGLVNSPVALIDGQGDFGDHASKAGAMRYTESRLAEFSDSVLLDPDYLAVTPMLWNYSEDKKIPLYLPAKLPMALLLGNEGIAFGVAVSSPSFSLESVKLVTERALEIASAKLLNTQPPKPLTSLECAQTLKFKFRFGGLCVSDISDIESFMKVGKGSLKFTPFAPSKILTAKSKRYVITSACPGFQTIQTIHKTLETIANIKGVTLVSDTSDFSGVKYAINIKQNLSQAEVLAIFAEIDRIMIKQDFYDIGLTHRGQTNTTFFKTNIPKLLVRWATWRLLFERKVLKYKIQRCRENLENLKLLEKAILNIRVIIKALESTDSKAYLMTHLNISEQDANKIRNFRIRDLEKSDLVTIQNNIIAVNSDIKLLKADHKSPCGRVINDMNNIVKKCGLENKKSKI